MANESNCLARTFNVRVPMDFQLSPVFNCIQSTHHRIRVRLLRKTLELFKSDYVKKISLLLEQARIDNQWITLTTLNAVDSIGEDSQEHSIPISAIDDPNDGDY